MHHQIKKAKTSIVPGNKDFNNAVKVGRKTYIPGTSMIKGIRRKEFNSKLNKCSTRFRPFIGATLKQMETYVKPILNDDTPDILILHIGCNDIGNKQLMEIEIAEWVVKIGRQCKEIIIIIINTLFEIGKVYIALQKIYSLIYTNQK